MNRLKSNIVLIGMPGSGKSTVGIVLAKMAGLDFVDTDILIQHGEQATLQAIVNERGYEALRLIEERVILTLDAERHVIATGGSAVYSASAMANLQSHGTIVFLDVSLEVLMARIGDYSQRGVAKRPDQTFLELLDERRVLYRQYADLTVSGDDLTHDIIASNILDQLKAGF